MSPGINKAVNLLPVIHQKMQSFSKERPNDHPDMFTKQSKTSLKPGKVNDILRYILANEVHVLSCTLYIIT